jgi:hypothetical protein
MAPTATRIKQTANVASTDFRMLAAKFISLSSRSLPHSLIEGRGRSLPEVSSPAMNSLRQTPKGVSDRCKQARRSK